MLVAAEPDAPIARHYPVPGGPQPPLDPGFGAELAAFAAAGGTGWPSSPGGTATR